MEKPGIIKIAQAALPIPSVSFPSLCLSLLFLSSFLTFQLQQHQEGAPAAPRSHRGTAAPDQSTQLLPASNPRDTLFDHLQPSEALRICVVVCCFFFFFLHQYPWKDDTRPTQHSASLKQRLAYTWLSSFFEKSKSHMKLEITVQHRRKSRRETEHGQQAPTLQQQRVG